MVKLNRSSDFNILRTKVIYWLNLTVNKKIEIDELIFNKLIIFQLRLKTRTSYGILVPNVFTFFRVSFYLRWTQWCLCNSLKMDTSLIWTYTNSFRICTQEETSLFSKRNGPNASKTNPVWWPTEINKLPFLLKFSIQRPSFGVLLICCRVELFHTRNFDTNYQRPLVPLEDLQSFGNSILLWEGRWRSIMFILLFHFFLLEFLWFNQSNSWQSNEQRNSCWFSRVFWVFHRCSLLFLLSSNRLCLFWTFFT